jgi:hypothetical protein
VNSTVQVWVDPVVVVVVVPLIVSFTTSCAPLLTVMHASAGLAL